MLADGEVGWTDGKRSLGLRTAAEMEEAVSVLVEADLVDVFTVPRETGGRPQRFIRAKGAKGAKDDAPLQEEESR